MIHVNYDIERNDLICSICYETVTTPLIQCSNANHFVCFDCIIINRNRNCPQCRTSKVFHNRLLEKYIKEQMVPCTNDGCLKTLFDWAVQEHDKICPFKQYKCNFCNDQISMESLNKHIKTGCKVDWVDFTRSDILCSLELDVESFCEKSSRGDYYIDLTILKDSLVFFYNEFVVFLLRNEMRWIVQALSHKKNGSKRMEITYWLPKQSDKYEIHTTIKIEPEHILDTVEKSEPEIPLEAVEMKFQVAYSTTDDDVSSEESFPF